MKIAPTADRLLSTWLVLVALGTLVALLGRLWWPFEIAAHFRVQLTGVALLGFGAAIALKAWRRMSGAGLLVAINVLPVLIGLGGAPQTPADDRRLTVIALNVNTFDGDPARVRAWLQTQDADVVGLTEVDAAWMTALAPLSARWPHQVVVPHRGNFGLALLSRHPVLSQDIWRLAGHPVQTLHAVLDTPLGLVDAVVAHPPPPMTAAWARINTEQIAALGARRPALGPRVLVMGDFNATPWARSMDPLFEAGLRHGRVGLGVQPSWPDGLLWLLGVPIDHVLVDGLVITAHRVGPSVGSDHRPLVATMGRAP